MKNNDGTPIEGFPSIRAFARAHGLPYQTVYSRVRAGETGDNLSRPAEHRGKEIRWGGRTFREWYQAVRARGFIITVGGIQSRYYNRPKHMTPDQALERFKKSYRLE